MDTRKLINRLKDLLLEFGEENVHNALVCAETELEVAKEVAEEEAARWEAIPEPIEESHIFEPPF